MSTRLAAEKKNARRQRQRQIVKTPLHYSFQRPPSCHDNLDRNHFAQINILPKSLWFSVHQLGFPTNSANVRWLSTYTYYVLATPPAGTREYKGGRSPSGRIRSYPASDVRCPAPLKFSLASRKTKSWASVRSCPAVPDV